MKETWFFQVLWDQENLTTLTYGRPQTLFQGRAKFSRGRGGGQKHNLTQINLSKFNMQSNLCIPTSLGIVKKWPFCWDGHFWFNTQNKRLSRVSCLEKLIIFEFVVNLIKIWGTFSWSIESILWKILAIWVWS
jgi:hypothetical protein